MAKAGAANRKQIICNVYDGEKWSHVEHFHPDCYAEAGEPHGVVTDTGKHYGNG